VGDPELLARDAASLTSRIFARLGERLAAYAVPSQVLLLPELPLTANGKVDRFALALLAANSAPDTAGAEPPRIGVESVLAELWHACLPGPVLDRNANFFTIGGDSLSAIRLVAAIERRFVVKVPVRKLLASPTVAALGAEIARAVATIATDTETGEL